MEGKAEEGLYRAIRELYQSYIGDISEISSELTKRAGDGMQGDWQKGHREQGR